MDKQKRLFVLLLFLFEFFLLLLSKLWFFLIFLFAFIFVTHWILLVMKKNETRNLRCKTFKQAIQQSAFGYYRTESLQWLAFFWGAKIFGTLANAVFNAGR